MEIPKLSLSKEEKEWGSGIIKQYSVNETYPLHTHDFYEIFFINSGKGLHFINGKDQLLTNGSIVFIRPYDAHSFKALNYFDFEIFSLGFVYDELSRVLELLEIPLTKITQPQLPIHIILEGINKAFMEQQLSLLLSKKQGTDRKKLSRSILTQSLYLLINYDTVVIERDIIPKWLVNLDDEMSKCENYILGLPKMLELCNYSQEYINRVFKKYLKTTPTEYINTKRITYAMELLLSKKIDIVEICYMVGFHSLGYFYSVFKKQYKCTPKQFLKRL